jgi:hypothetical protein
LLKILPPAFVSTAHFRDRKLSLRKLVLETFNGLLSSSFEAKIIGRLEIFAELELTSLIQDGGLVLMIS